MNAKHVPFLINFVGLILFLPFCSDYDKKIANQINTKKANIQNTKLSKATFAGGCFWCVEADFEKLNGVVEAISGYSGGHTKNPSYKSVNTEKTGHAEAVQIYYDPKIVSYEKLVFYFWRKIDPTDGGGQFVDRGSSYRPVIFYQNEMEKKFAIKSRTQLSKSGRFTKALQVEIVPLKKFYKAEEYHQDFYRKNSPRYQSYRQGSGRDQFLERIWRKK